jgi:hypothetical protein
MFVQTNDSSLVFIRSKYIKAFPCSRRRSTPIDADGDAATVRDRYYIPFDPEARLNTEANNRKHSGLNGYKQNYLYNWDSASSMMSLVLDGYLFEIQLADGYKTPELFGQRLEEFLTTSGRIFVNIRVEEVEFFAGGRGVPAATTGILRNQTSTIAPSSSLDTLIDDSNVDNLDNYFFSGLSFSNTPIVSSNVISMCILEKSSNMWNVYEPARLPVIDHGSTPNSVKVGTLEADSIALLGQGGVATMKVVETSSDIFQLQFITN